MARLVAAPRHAGLTHAASVHGHELTHPELAGDPDFRSTFPPHCLRGTRGARKVPETEQDDPLPISLIPFPPLVLERLVEGRRELLLLKTSFDVFTNPNAEPLVAALDPDEVIL